MDLLMKKSVGNSNLGGKFPASFIDEFFRR